MRQSQQAEKLSKDRPNAQDQNDAKKGPGLGIDDDFEV
jgi:hypothetical protein